MIKAILIVDEVYCLGTLSNLLKEYCRDVHLIEQCHSGKEGLLCIKKTTPDLVMSDNSSVNVSRSRKEALLKLF